MLSSVVFFFFFSVCVCVHFVSFCFVVQAALHEIAEKEGGLDKSKASAYIANLKKSGRYLQDIW
eukprot:COSAG06_NODE_2023_length_7816_cov_52.135415_6_plen_64_part_00